MYGVRRPLKVDGDKPSILYTFHASREAVELDYTKMYGGETFIMSSAVIKP